MICSNYKFNRMPPLYTLISLLVLGCTSGEDKSEISRLTKENSELEFKNTGLSNQIVELEKKVSTLETELKKALETPELFKSRIAEIVSREALFEAKAELDKFAERFPSKPLQYEQANSMVKGLETTLAKREQEKERIARLGFKATSDVAKVSFSDVEYSTASVAISNTFTFDSYDDTYHYRTADKDQKYVSMRVTVSSKSKDPTLVPFLIYRIEGQTLYKQEELRYEFRRWESHGTYIGLYHDDGNDFAKSKNVLFNVGAQVPEELAGKAFAVVAGPDGCIPRRERKVGNPEVMYLNLGSECSSIPSTISLTDLTTNTTNMRLVKIVNRNKL